VRCRLGANSESDGFLSVLFFFFFFLLYFFFPLSRRDKMEQNRSHSNSILFPFPLPALSVRKKIQADDGAFSPPTSFGWIKREKEKVPACVEGLILFLFPPGNFSFFFTWT